MKFYNQGNGKLIAKADFLTGQIISYGVEEKNEREIIFSFEMTIYNILPKAPLKNIQKKITLIGVITGHCDFEAEATIYTENEFYDTTVKMEEKEIIRLLCYIINTKIENQ